MSGIPRPPSATRPASRARTTPSSSVARASPTPTPSRAAIGAVGDNSAGNISISTSTSTSNNTRSSAPNAVQVAVRIRPLTSSDQSSIPARWQRTAIIADGTSHVRVEPSAGLGGGGGASTSSSSNNQYVYDQVLAPAQGQADVYTESVQGIIPRFFEGYNATILAYGQTSSGKSYTMGTAGAPSHYPPPDEPGAWDADTGIIPRAIADIFHCINRDTRPGSSYSLTVSFIELYNEDLIDLLADIDRPADLRPLVQIRQDRGQIVWSGMNEMTVHGVEDVMALLAQGNAVRRTNQTDMNAQSSRSHAIFSLTLTHKRSASTPAMSLSSTGENIATSSSPQFVSSPPSAARTPGFERAMSPPSGRRTVAGRSTPTGLNTPGNRLSGLPRPQSALSRPSNYPPSPTPTPTPGGASMTGKRFSMFALRPPSAQGTSSAPRPGHKGRSASQGTNLPSDGETITTVSKFHFVDLAGSERLKRTSAKGERIKEGISINSGLHALGNVISALGDVAKGKKSVHVPYRDSKLTRLLQDSLGGNAYTLMIACVSPAEWNLSESANTLGYAQRARAIRNKAEVNEHEPGWDDLSHVQSLVMKLRRELREVRLGRQPTNTTPGTVTKELPIAAETHETVRQQQDRLAELMQEMAQIKMDNARLTQRVRRQSAALLQGLGTESSDEDYAKDSFLESAEPVILEYEKSIDVLTGQINLLKAALGHSEDVIGDLEQQVTEQEDQLAEKEQGHELLSQELLDTRATKEKLADREVTANDYVVELETRLSAAEQRQTDSDERVASLRKEIVRYESTEQRNESYIQELETRLAQSDADLVLVKSTMDKYEAQAAHDQSANDTIASLDSSQDDRKLLLVELNSKQDRIDALEQQLRTATEAQAKMVEAALPNAGSSSRALAPITTPVQAKVAVGETASPDELVSVREELQMLKSKHATTVAELGSAHSAHQETLQRAEVLSSQLADLSIIEASARPETPQARSVTGSSSDDPLEVLSPHFAAPLSEGDDSTPGLLCRRGSLGSRREFRSHMLRSHTDSDLARVLNDGTKSARSSLTSSEARRSSIVSAHEATRPLLRGMHRRSLSSIGYRPADAPATARDLNDVSSSSSHNSSTGSPSPRKKEISGSRHGRALSMSSNPGHRPLSLLDESTERPGSTMGNKAAMVAEEAQRKIRSLEQERDTLSTLLNQREEELDGLQTRSSSVANGSSHTAGSPAIAHTPLADELTAVGVTELRSPTTYASHSLPNHEDPTKVQELLAQLATQENTHKDALAAQATTYDTKLADRDSTHAEVLAKRDQAGAALTQVHRALQEQYAIAQVAAAEAAEQADGARTRVEQLEHEVEEARTSHTTKLDQLAQEHQAVLAQREVDHAHALEDHTTKHTESLEAAKQEHAQALEKLKEEHGTILAGIQSERDADEQRHTGAMTKLAAQHDEAISALNSERANKVEELQAKHDDAMGEIKRAHDAELAQVVEVSEQAHARTTALQSTLAEEQAQATKEHAEALAAAEAAAASTLATRMAEHKHALAARDDVHARKLQEVREEHSAALRAAAEQDQVRAAQSVEQRDTSLTRWRAEHAEALDNLRTHHESTLAAALAKAKEEHANELDQVRTDLNDSHVRSLDASKAAHESGTAAAVATAVGEWKEQHRSALSDLAAKHEQQLAQTKRSFQEAHESAVHTMVEQHASALKDFEARFSASWKEREAAHQAESDQLNDALTAEREASSQAITQATSDHEQALHQLRSEHQAALASVSTDKDRIEAMSQAQDEHQVALVHAEEQHLALIQQLRLDHGEATAKLVQEHEVHLQEAQATHRTEIQAIRDEHQAALRNLDDQNERHAQSLDLHGRELAERDAQHRRLADQITSLNQACDKADSAAAQHEARVAQLISQVQVDPVELDMLKAELAETSDALVVLEGALTEAQAERDQLATDLAVLRETTSGMSNDPYAHPYAPGDGRPDSAILMRELDAQRSFLSQARSDLARSQAEAQAAQTECARNEALLRDTQQRLAQAEHNAASTRSNRSSLRDPLDDSTGRITSWDNAYRTNPSAGSSKVPPPPTPPPAGPPPPTPNGVPSTITGLARSSSVADSVASATAGPTSTHAGPAPVVTLSVEERQRTLDEIQKLQTRLSQLETESHASSDLIVTLEAALSDEQRNLRKARTQLAEATRERDAFSTRSQELQQQVDTAANELVSTQARVDEQRQVLEKQLEQERAARDKARQDLSARLDEMTKRKNNRLFSCM